MTDVTEDAIKLFGMTSQLIEHALDRVEREHAIDLGRSHRSTAEVDEAYYPQIESAIRAEAAQMAPHYEMFYSLETTIRRSVRDQLAAQGDDPWQALIPEAIRLDAEKVQQREKDSGVTPRSEDLIDFLTFGQLGEVIKANWDIFAATFSSKKAVEKVMASLNMLRGPIAHFSPLAEDEVVRLRLTVRDWFRLAEESEAR
jgi:Swt1-like HEPN